MGSTRDLLTARPLERVELRATGSESVYLRVVTGRERMLFFLRYSEAEKDVEKQYDAVAFLIGCSLCEPDGARCFPPGEEGKAAEIPYDIFQELRDQVFRINRIGAAAEEEERGKSSASPSGGSGS